MEQQTMTQQITWEQFEENYQPETNTLDPNASMGGLMFETYGAEYDYVLYIHKSEPERVWTVMCDTGNVDVTSGLHCVNRLGYIITQEPAVGLIDVINEDYNEVKDFYSHQCPSCDAFIEGNPEVGDSCDCGFVFDLEDFMER
jgi:hypothetical protein